MDPAKPSNLTAFPDDYFTPVNDSLIFFHLPHWVTSLRVSWSK